MTSDEWNVICPEGTLVFVIDGARVMRARTITEAVTFDGMAPTVAVKFTGTDMEGQCWDVVLSSVRPVGGTP